MGGGSDTLCDCRRGLSPETVRALCAAAGVGADSAALDAFFSAKPVLTGSHVLFGLALTAGIPVQFSAQVRGRFPRIHRWLGRVLVAVGLLVALSAYGMMAAPVGGWLETSATSIYGTAFLVALLTAWRQIRRGDVRRHREWMLRAVGIVLGIATTRPVTAVFFATSTITGLEPSQFFGMAMWIGFTSTLLATEWYIRRTRPTATSVRLDHVSRAQTASRPRAARRLASPKCAAW